MQICISMSETEKEMIDKFCRKNMVPRSKLMTRITIDFIRGRI